MDAIMVREKTEQEERQSSATDTLNKIAVAIIGAVLMFLVAQLWGMKNDLSELEVGLAQTRGEVFQITKNMNVLMDQGSRTVQRLEVVVENLAKRFEKFDQFMSTGPRFTKDDGDKLEKRVERLEQQKK